MRSSRVTGSAWATSRSCRIFECDVETLESAADAAAAEGHTPVFVAVDGAIAGLIAVADPVKPSAATR